MAERRLRDPQSGGGAGETPLPSNREKDLQIAEILSTHFLSRCWPAGCRKTAGPAHGPEGDRNSGAAPETCILAIMGFSYGIMRYLAPGHL
ncbi:hypothetical protein GCM10028812_01010 [Ancylobacter sonchi]